MDRYWSFFAVILLFLAFIMTSLKIQSTEWTENLHLLNWLTFIGYVIGLAIGYSLFRPFFVSLLIFLYSIILLPWVLTTTYSGAFPWLVRVENLIGRINFTIDQLLSNTRIEDPILFLVFLSTIVWFTSLIGGYLLTRKSQPWIPLLISGITIFTSEIYDQIANHLYTGFFIFFVLILISQTSFFKTGRNWRIKGIPVDGDTQSLIRKSAIIVSLIIVLLSWNVTNIVFAFQKGSPQQRQVMGLLADIQNQFSRITAPLQGTAYIQSEFFGDTLNLGTGSDLSDEVVFEISVNQRKPSGARYYWRARSYDTFENNQWVSKFETSKLYEANDQLDNFIETNSFPKRTFTIITKKNLGLLYTPSNPQKIDRPIKAFIDVLPENQNEIIAITVEQITFSGEKYQVDNIIPNPTIAQMRKSTDEYPEWVTETYLQLPQNFSEKITELAEEITGSYSNQFDRTNAITNYLRDTITYKKQIPEPPEGADSIEWFLFEHKEGFCNYYATAQVLMLRSIGIPSRIVFGYAEGEAQNSTETEFLVKREQLHAWPEVYFENIGWVEFEPTTIQPTIDRMVGENSSTSNEILSVRDPNRELPLLDGGESEGVGGVIPEITPAPTQIEEEVESKPNVLPYILMSVGLITLLLLFLRRNKNKQENSAPVVIESFLMKRGWKVPRWLKLWSQYIKLSPEAKAFSRITWSLLIFREPILLSSTPAELINDYNKIFPEMAKEANLILFEYQKALYSTQQKNLVIIQENANHIFRHTILTKFQNFFQLRKKYSGN